MGEIFLAKCAEIYADKIVRTSVILLQVHIITTDV